VEGFGGGGEEEEGEEVGDVDENGKEKELGRGWGFKKKLSTIQSLHGTTEKVKRAKGGKVKTHTGIQPRT
jgi:hypothetical protein